MDRNRKRWLSHNSIGQNSDYIYDLIKTFNFDENNIQEQLDIYSADQIALVFKIGNDRIKVVVDEDNLRLNLRYVLNNARNKRQTCRPFRYKGKVIFFEGIDAWFNILEFLERRLKYKFAGG